MFITSGLVTAGYYINFSTRCSTTLPADAQITSAYLQQSTCLPSAFRLPVFLIRQYFNQQFILPYF